jgi:hypothetical protein
MTNLMNSQTNTDGFRYHALLVGGVESRNTRGTAKKLEQYRIKVIEQWAPGSSGNAFINSKKVIPERVDLVVFLSGFLSHSLQDHVEKLAVKRHIKYIAIPFSKSKWPSIFKVTGIDTSPVIPPCTSVATLPPPPILKPLKLKCEYCEEWSVKQGLCAVHYASKVADANFAAENAAYIGTAKPKRTYNWIGSLVRTVCVTKKEEFVEIVKDIGREGAKSTNQFVEKLWSACQYRHVLPETVTKSTVEKLIANDDVAVLIHNTIQVQRISAKRIQYGIISSTTPKKDEKPQLNPVFDPSSTINRLNQADVDLDALLQLVESQVADMKALIKHLRETIK